MNPLDTSHRNPQLAAALSRWSTLVARVSRTSGRGQTVSEQEYQAAYTRLLNGCLENSRRQEAGFYRKLAAFVQPWITVETIKKADERIVVDLMAKCQVLEIRLSGKRPFSRRTRRWLMFAVVVVLAAGALSVSWAAKETWWNWDMVATMRGMGFRASRYIQHVGFAAKVGIVSLVVIVVGTILLQGMRKY